MSAGFEPPTGVHACTCCVPPMAVYTCPACRRTSHNPNDAEHGYCGACHAFTGPEAPERLLAARAEPTTPAS